MQFHERQVTAEEELDAILRQGKFVTIGLCDRGRPYVVTLSYGLDQAARRLYLHTARVGHKLEVLAVNPAACGTVIRDLGYQESSCKHCYESVVIDGRLRVVEDVAEREHAMRVLLRHLEPDPESAWRRYRLHEEGPWKTVQILSLDIERVTGKRSD
jgi:uncharacterized protein